MLVRDHWINTDPYIIRTHPCQRLEFVVQRWALMDIPGAYTWGWPKVGKTHSVLNLEGRIRTRNGQPIHCALIPHSSETATTDRKFYGRLRHSLFNSLPKGDATSYMNDVLNKLKDLADVNRERRVILLLDEAQTLKRLHYEFLVNIHNLLDTQRPRKYRPLFISVGSNRLPNEIEKLDPVDDAYLRMRFFQSYHRQFGLLSEAEVKHAVSWYDRPQPQFGSMRGYVADMLPGSFARGFRMERLAALLWDGFIRAMPKWRNTGWHMQFFVVTIRNLLNELIVDGALEIDPERIDSAIVASGLQGPIEDAAGDLVSFKPA